MGKIEIRVATVEDAQEILGIYAPYIEKTAITFEYVVPTVEEFAKRIQSTLENYPYLVAELDGEIVGYAYASQFHPRAACRWDVETTVYVKQERKGLGIGKALYQELEYILKRQNFLNLNASIAYVDGEDPYVTDASIRFHERMGYRKVGEFHQCGLKFGRWYSLVWMEKHIGEHIGNPLPIKTFPMITKEEDERHVDRKSKSIF